jgi:hypothetical protein
MNEPNEELNELLDLDIHKCFLNLDTKDETLFKLKYELELIDDYLLGGDWDE